MPARGARGAVRFRMHRDLADACWGALTQPAAADVVLRISATGRCNHHRRTDLGEPNPVRARSATTTRPVHRARYGGRPPPVV